MSQKLTFQIGDEDIVIYEQPIRFTKVWKDTHIKPLIDQIERLEMTDLSQVTNPDILDDNNQPSSDIGETIAFFKPIIQTVLNAPDIVVDAVMDWCALEEEVLDTATYREFIEPFKAILGMVYPFGQMIGGLNLEAITGTKSNLPSQNGGGRKKKPRPNRLNSKQ